MKFSTIVAVLSALSTAAAATFPSYITTNNSPPPTDRTFINECIQKVNSIRRNYGAPPLEWSADIAQVALRKSNGCRLDHGVCISLLSPSCFVFLTVIRVITARMPTCGGPTHLA